MLKRTVSLIYFSTINNRRLFSLTSISNSRYEQKNKTEVNNQHREFAKFHSNSKNQIKQNKKEEDLDVKKPQFNRYNLTQSHSKPSSKKNFFDDEENDLFAEEKDDLTMLGTDKKAFSSSSTTSNQKPSTTAISLTRKTEKFVN